MHAIPFSRFTPTNASFEILDIEFFDDVEVALLLRMPVPGSRRLCFMPYACWKCDSQEADRTGTDPKYALATVRYRELGLAKIDGGQLSLAHFEVSQPLLRYAYFCRTFELKAAS